MIIVKLRGGLGNVLFQYAIGRHLAYENNEDLKVDTSIFKNRDKRPYTLYHFNIAAEEATKEDVERLRGSLFTKISDKILDRLRPYYKRKLVFQQGRRFDPHVLEYVSNAYLFGYWQSERYFKDIEGIIRQDITLKPEYQWELDAEEDIVRKMRETDSVAINIRRGDRLTTEFGGLSHKYYKEAMRYMESRLENVHYFAFSDDIQWVKENITFNRPVHVVDHFTEYRGEKDYLDLILMSKCKHTIIANSTYSWWGAWLTERPDKIIIAPTPYSEKDPGEIIPDRWITIPR